MLVEAPDGTLVEWNTPEWRARTDFAPSLPDPLAVLVPYLDREPEWLVLGGLGDSPDGQEALQRWPKAKLLGVDPDPRSIAWQREHGWPADAPLFEVALAAGCGFKKKMAMDQLNCASLHELQLVAVPKSKIVCVPTVTLDTLDALFRFENAVLWLDLEDYECFALKGARHLLRSGRVLAVNVETRYHLDWQMEYVPWLLTTAGYERRLIWFRQWWGHNEVWTPRA